MDAIEAILTRRSTRRFAPEPPSRELVGRVVEAGRYAPSGQNNQTTHLIVVSDATVLDELAVLVRTEFAQMDEGPDTYASLRNSIAASKKGNYVFHYNAPVLVIAANKTGYGNALTDTACVLENMMIASNALDLGACWINQLHWLDDNERVRDCLRGLGLADDETVTGGLALGLPETGEPARTPLARTGNPVTWVG